MYVHYDDLKADLEGQMRQMAARLCIDVDERSYVDRKWDKAAPNSRRATADALATAMQALLTPGRRTPSPEQVRQALYSCA